MSEQSEILAELRALREKVESLVAEAQFGQQLAYSPKQAAKLLGVSSSTLYRMVKSGRLVVMRVGNHKMISASALRSIFCPPPAFVPTRERAPRKPVAQMAENGRKLSKRL